MPSRLKFALLILPLLLVACAEQSLAEQREANTRRATANDPIVIGFVWPFEADWDFLPEGVDMAVDEINSSGGILGRPLEIVRADDHDSVIEGRQIAQDFAENTEMLAVIGHAWSYISVPASPIYEFNGLIMLSPSATSPDLTRDDFNFIFRNVASDDEVGRQLARYALDQGYRDMMILYVNDPNGRELSNVFENEASGIGISIIDRRNYQGERNFPLILDDWEDLEFDAIFIAGQNPDAATFIAQAREAGITVPIIGSDGLDTSDLADVAGDAAEGTVVASHYHADNPREELQDFIQRFEAYYADFYGEGQPLTPDTWAAQGYDAVYLLKHAIEQAETVTPAGVAEALHNTTDWQGVTGPHTFDSTGDVIGKSIVLKVLENGEFRFLQLATDDGG